MLTVVRLLFFSSFSIFIIFCCAKEIHLECDDIIEVTNIHISRVLQVCDIRGFEITENDSEISFVNVSQNNFTKIEVTRSKFLVLPTKIVDLFPQVVAFEVCFSGMTRIEDYTFRNASQLLDLSITINELTEITEFTLAGAVNVISLDLNTNQITNVSPKAFNLMPKLERLILGANRISSLDKEIFSLLKNLKYLDVSFNKLTEIDSKLFVHTEHLSYLNLARNKFNEVELELSTKVKMNRLDFEGIRKLTLR